MTVLSSEDNHLPREYFIQYLRQNEPNSSDYKNVKTKIENVKTKLKNTICVISFVDYLFIITRIYMIEFILLESSSRL